MLAFPQELNILSAMVVGNLKRLTTSVGRIFNRTITAAAATTTTTPTTTTLFIGRSITPPHSCVHHSRHHYSADQFASNVGAAKPSSRLEDHHGYQKWDNGGGTFHESACVAATALIEIGAIVHPKAVIGANAHIGSGAVVGPDVTVGQSTKIGYNVALGNCAIGDYCLIHNGVCIGQDGFGFFHDEHGDMVKKPQILKALIGHHVEIGANTCIDRGSWRDTTIGDYTKIDNLVQIGHNVVIGKCCMLCGQVGIAGSVMIGDFVTLGGRVAVRDHVSIVSKVRLAANSFVTKDINEPGDYGGFPAVPIREWRRQVVIHRRTLK